MSLGQAVRAGRVQCEECNPLDGLESTQVRSVYVWGE